MPHGNNTSQPQNESVVLVTGVVALGLFAAPLINSLSNAVFSWWSEPSSTQLELAKQLETANQLYTALYKMNGKSIPAATCQKWKKELEEIASHKSFTAQDENKLEQLLKEMTRMRIVIKLKLLEKALSSYELDIDHLERDGYWLTPEIQNELQEARRPLQQWKKEIHKLKNIDVFSETEEKEIEALQRKIAVMQEGALSPIKVKLAPQCLAILFGRMPNVSNSHGATIGASITPSSAM